MKTKISKSLFRTILGVFLLAVAVMFSSGLASTDQVGQKADSVNTETSQSGLALDIGGQSAPRNSNGGLAFSAPIGGTEVPKSKLPAALETTNPDSEDFTNIETSNFDIGGQSPPRTPRGAHGFYSPIGGTEVPKTKLPRAAGGIIAVISEDRTSPVIAGSDIGGPQTPPRNIGRPRVVSNCLIKNLES